jgi:hypothetical protein
MTAPHEFSTDEERWTPIQTLIWIATRSRRFMDALKRLPLSSVEDRLWRIQSENHSPHPMILSHALLALREEAKRGHIPGLDKTFPRESDATIGMLNVHDFARLDISFRAADVLRTWPGWPPALAWNAAKTRPWQAPTGIPKGWIRNLLPADYLPFAEVVKLLASGPTKMAIGLPRVEEEAERLRVGIAIVDAAAKGKVTLVGTPCERLENAPHLLHQLSPRTLIEPSTLHDLSPVPLGGGDWLGPRRYADEYAETGHAPESVSFCDVLIERKSLIKWMPILSAQAPRLSEADVRKLLLDEKAEKLLMTIGAAEQLIKAKDPLFPRDSIRKIARGLGIEGRRGRPKNSAK